MIRYTPKQRDLMRLWQHNELCRLNLLEGSVSSGKTWISLVLWAFWVKTMPQDGLYMMCAKSLTTLKRNCLLLLQDQVGENNFKFSLAAKEGYLFGRRILLEGANDARSESKIRGLTLQGAYCDELTQFPEDFFAMLLSRLRMPGAKLFATTNPDSPMHWLKTNYIDRADELDFLDVKFTIDDNTELDPEYVTNIKREYVGVYYDRFILGNWVLAEGIIYRDFADNTEDYLIDDPLTWCREHDDNIRRVVIGVDFGGTGSANKFQATGITDKLTVLALDEEYIDKAIDPDALNRRFSAFVERVAAVYGASQTRADSAEQILIRGFQNTAKRDRLPTTVLNAKKMEIHDRIKLTLLLMAQNRFYVCRKCEHLIDALSTAIYDPKRFDDTRLDDGTTDIDSLDAFEYCLEPFYEQLLKYGQKPYQSILR